MVKKCVWCHPDGCNSKDDFYYIHKKCSEELMDVDSNLKAIREILEGTHARNRLDIDRLKLVSGFIEDMEDFKRRWNNTIKIIEQKEVSNSSQQ